MIGQVGQLDRSIQHSPLHVLSRVKKQDR